MLEINENTVIKNGKTFKEINFNLENRLYDNNSRREPKSFEEIFGDLSDCIFVGDLNLNSLGLHSLKGCPQRIRYGNLHIAYNPDLLSLDYFPKKITDRFELFVDFDIVHELKNLDISVYKELRIYINFKISFDMVLFNKKDILKKIVYSLSDYRAVNGSFAEVSGFFSSDIKSFNRVEFEKLYQLYERVGLNQEKFNRVVELL